MSFKKIRMKMRLLSNDEGLHFSSGCSNLECLRSYIGTLACVYSYVSFLRAPPE